MSRLQARVRRAERGATSRPARSELPEQHLSPADQAFFERMMARSIAGDRNWSPEDMAKYQDMLLGEWESHE